MTAVVSIKENRRPVAPKAWRLIEKEERVANQAIERSHFVVTLAHGPAWAAELPMRRQELWLEHAACMDRLTARGLVILGGPLGDGALLICRAESETEIRQALAEDPWKGSGHLRLATIERWPILLDHHQIAD